MDYLEIKEGEINLKGIVLDEKTQYEIKALSLVWGIELKETCDRINRVLQAFFDIWDTLKELAERILEVMPQREDICESCINRRTRHGSSSRAEKPRKAVANIKWSEKYRPP